MLPIHDTWVTQPSVARSGGRLIYRTFRDVIDIWSLPLDENGMAAGEPVKVVASTRSEHQPAGSPAGDRIAFISDRSGSTEVWSAEPSGLEATRHTDFRGPIPNSPCWSPDGSRILFDVAVDGQSDLWSVARDGRELVRVTWAPSEERNGTFSRDGRWIYFASDRSGEWQIWRMPAEGGASEMVTERGGFFAQESLDGEMLYYAKMDEPGLWRMAIAGGSGEAVLQDLDLADWGSWVVGATGVYFVTRSPTSVQFVNFTDGSTHTAFAPSKQVPYLGRCLSLSPGGRSILFSMIDHSDDEVMRVDLVAPSPASAGMYSSSPSVDAERRSLGVARH